MSEMMSWSATERHRARIHMVWQIESSAHTKAREEVQRKMGYIESFTTIQCTDVKHIFWAICSRIIHLPNHVQNPTKGLDEGPQYIRTCFHLRSKLTIFCLLGSAEFFVSVDRSPITSLQS